MTLVGDGQERARWTSLCEELGLLAQSPGEVGKVWFAGWMPQAACAAELARSHALVLPSLMECGGAVVLEAMAASRPVIATRWGGPVDYLDEDCGVLVEPSSASAMVSQLAEAMRDVIARPGVWAQRGQAGRARVVAMFDWEVKMNQVETLYLQLLGARKFTKVAVPQREAADAGAPH